MTAYDRHLTARQESRDARIEAEQDEIDSTEGDAA